MDNYIKKLLISKIKDRTCLRDLFWELNSITKKKTKQNKKKNPKPTHTQRKKK
jgi:hypothetical protein